MTTRLTQPELHMHGKRVVSARTSRDTDAETLPNIEILCWPEISTYYPQKCVVPIDADCKKLVTKIAAWFNYSISLCQLGSLRTFQTSLQCVK